MSLKELKKQIDQLSLDNHVLKTAFIEQQEQIEKLKCCGNCINRGLNKDDISYPCCDCKHWRKNKSNDYWEMEK